MTDYLVISVHDLSVANEPHPVQKMKVRIGFDGASPVPVDTLADKKKWTRQIECPAGAAKVQVIVESTDEAFWPADTTVTLNREAGKPLIDRSALRLFNVTDVLAHQEGANWVVRMEITVSQLRDFEHDVVEFMDELNPRLPARSGASTKNFIYQATFNTHSNRWWRVIDPSAPRILTGIASESAADDLVSEASWARIAFATDAEAPVGRLYFAKRKNKNDPHGTAGPRFIAIWRPCFVDFSRDTLQSHGFHIFFHPFTPKSFHDNNVAYNDLANRYLMTDKNLVSQHYLTGRKVVLVMPVGSDENQMGDITSSWDNVDRLLREVLFFMLRMEQTDPLTMRLQKVGRVAVSGFSFGINHVRPIVENAPGSSMLREVYNFDGIEEESPGRAHHFNLALLDWLKRSKGGDPRYFRIYGQDPSPDAEKVASSVGDNTHPVPIRQQVTVAHGWDTHTQLREASGKPITRPATYPVTMQEWENDTRTVVSIPSLAWQGLLIPFAPGVVGGKDRNGHNVLATDARRYDMSAHQAIPRLFVFHAIDRSGFPK